MFASLSRGFSDQPQLRAIQIIIVGLIGLLVISYLAPAIVSLMVEPASTAKSRRAILMTWLASRWAAAVNRFWATRAAEPKTPTIYELSRLSSAVEGCGHDAADRFEALDRTAVERIEVLRSLGLTEGGPASISPSLAQASARGTVGSVIAALILAVVLGGVNAFLLGIFFKERLGSQRILPYPLPDIEASQILAWLFFIFEVSIGFAVYRNLHGDEEEMADTRTATTAIRLMPWFAFFALMIVETLAYAALSQRMELPRLLQMSPDSALTPIVANVFAVFGAGITMMLAYQGHALARAIHRHQSAKAARALTTAIGRLKSSSSEVRALNEALATTRAEADVFPTRLTEHFESVVAVIRTDGELIVALRTAIAAAQRSPNVDGTPSGEALRTRNQIVGDWLSHVAVLIVIVLLAILVHLESELAFANTFTVAWAAPGVGYACAALAAILGLLTRSALSRLRDAAPVPNAIDGVRGRRLLGWSLVGLSVLVTLAHCILAVKGLRAANVWLTSSIGLVQGAALITLGMFLDHALVTIWSLCQLAWLGVVWAIVMLLSLLASLVEVSAYVVSLAIRLLAIPGDSLRKLLPRRKAPSSQLA